MDKQQEARRSVTDRGLWNQVWERLEKSNNTTNKNLCVPETKIGTKSQSNYAMVESMLPFHKDIENIGSRKRFIQQQIPTIHIIRSSKVLEDMVD